jgi:hypothetical protein
MRAAHRTRSAQALQPGETTDPEPQLTWQGVLWRFRFPGAPFAEASGRRCLELD